MVRCVPRKRRRLMRQCVLVTRARDRHHSFHPSPDVMLDRGLKGVSGRAAADVIHTFVPGADDLYDR